MKKYIETLNENKNKRVVIYGIGRNTKYLLENYHAQNLVGLMDAEHEGDVLYGYPIFSAKEAEKKADIIIIVARRAAVRIIYKRIKPLEEKGITICNLLGLELSSTIEISREIEENPYWTRNLNELLKKIDSCEAVSFDIFDTLITRKVLKPSDIFKIVEEKLNRKGKNVNFAELRERAEKEACQKKESPTLDEIYLELRNALGISEEEAKLLQEKEIQTEFLYICPRKTIVQALHYAIEQKKQVYLISDMYLKQDELRKLLKKCGIEEEIKIFVSCELNQTKENGGLYEIYKSYIGDKRALHIGDNLCADVQKAEEAGIDTYYIKSGYEMLMASALSDVLANVTTLEERKILGCFVASTFNDPFCLSEAKGRLKLGTLFEFGYNIAAPIFMTFVSMMVEYAEKHADTEILFCARDGFLIKQLYEEVKRTERYKNLPEGIYFLTSRRAISVACVQSWEDIELILEKTTLNDCMGNLLENKFGIKPKDNDFERDIKIVGDEGRTQLKKYIRKYEEDILRKAELERQGYKKYLGGLSIQNKDCIVFDFVTTGTTVYYINKLFGKGEKLICFATANTPNCFTEHLKESVSLFENKYSNSSEWNFINSYMVGECILTSPKGQLISFDQDGKPIFRGENDSFANMSEVHRGISEYLKELLERENHLLDYRKCLRAADSIWGLLNKRYSDVSEVIKKSFRSENVYDGVAEQEIWEYVI
ncbi:MAG: hypothetical protein ACI4LO_02565 [Anaerovoracaceae bacterium]